MTGASSRRRGEALESAILAATLDELAECGYAALTMERVAERAGAGKASLYRRWPSRVELVMAAARYSLTDHPAVVESGSLRDELISLFRAVAEWLSGPGGAALRGVIGEALGDVNRDGRLGELSEGTAVRAIGEIVERAVRRGEVAPDAVHPRKLEAGVAILRHRFLLDGRIDDNVITEVVDEVMVPLLVP